MGARSADPIDPIDLSGLYTLISGLPVLARNDDVVQIGGEPPNWLLLHHAPADSVSILRRLDGTSPLAAVLTRHQADPLLWSAILTSLRDAGLLVAAGNWSFPGMTPGPFLEPERDSLVHRHGVAAAARVMQARQDAVVVVRGSGRVATSIAGALAFAGIGHVHQQPDRALRLADLPEFQTPADSSRNPSADRADRAGSSGRVRVAGADGAEAAGAAGGTSAVRRRVSAVLAPGSPTRADFSLLASNLRRMAPTIKVHPPAAQHRVCMVVLAGDGPPAPSLGAELTGQGIPHLAVSAGLTRAVVGPLVLPGRSSCLACALRRRTDLDQGRPAFEEHLRRQLIIPPAQMVYSITALAVTEALDHVDGITIPATVDGTIEWQLGELAPATPQLGGASGVRLQRRNQPPDLQNPGAPTTARGNCDRHPPNSYTMARCPTFPVVP